MSTWIYCGAADPFNPDKPPPPPMFSLDTVAIWIKLVRFAHLPAEHNGVLEIVADVSERMMGLKKKKLKAHILH